MAHNQPSERSGQSARVSAVGSASISAHRLFPAVVAIWFAALLGLGCAVLPASLYERAVAATGLATLLPAAAPPLGLTARILLSLAAALFGAALGHAIARRIAGPQADRGTIRSELFSRITGLQPITAKEELGSGGFDALADAEPEEAEPEQDWPEEDWPEEDWSGEDRQPAPFVSEAIPEAAEWQWPVVADEIEPIEEPAAEWQPDEPAAAPADEETGFDPAPASESVAPEAPAAPALRPRAPYDQPPLDQLGFAGLTERLGRSLRDARHLPPVPPALLARLKAAQTGVDPEAFAPEEPDEEEAAGPCAHWPATLPPEAIGLESFGEEEAEEDEDNNEDGADEGDESEELDAFPDTPVPSTNLGSFRDYARDYIGGDDGEEEEEEEEESVSAGAAYGSLLSMKIPKKDPNAISPLDGLPPEALGLEMPGFAPGEIERRLPSALE